MTLALVPSSAVNDAPTNPMFTNTAFSDSDRIYTAIVPNGDISFTLAHFAGSVTEYSNLNNTKGFRIKCYDAYTGEGVQFNPADFDTGNDATTYDYFVLIYSDDDYKHHFAKIKEIINEDEAGDAFEFEPKIGNEIPKNTKFMIFKGPTKATDVVALSAGILQDSTSADLEANLVCARPLFYFYGGLDKDGELDHNTKYYAMQNGGTAASYLLDNTVSSPKDNHTFRTVQDFGKTIIDYGKHSLRVTLTDKLRDLDIASGGSTTTNEGNSVSLDYGDYEAAFPNARRDINDELTSLSYTGPIRYIHYGHSPLRANFTYGVYSHKTYDSVNGRGGFSETKIVDTARILQKKITEFTDYKVKHLVHRANLDAWFELSASFSSDAGSHVFTFDTDFDLDGFINEGDELKIGDRIFIVETGGIGLFSNFSQTITMRNRSRLETESILSSGYYTPSSGEKIYRRCYNFTDKTLMVDFDLIDNRYSKLSISFISLNMEELFASVTAVDANRKLVTLAFAGDSYYGDPLQYTSGDFLVHVERFNGEIEETASKKENGQTVFEVKGRDKFNKLISPIVNLNSLFSEDIVYSSNSPYNKLATIQSGGSFTVSFGSTGTDTGLASLTIYPKEGDKLFTTNGYIGEMTSDAFLFGGTWRLAFTSALAEANSEELYVDTEKNYILAKALGASHLATNSPTSLTGSANKGLFFTGGNQINSATGAELNTLIGTSNHDNPKALGYAINSPNSISQDRSFQAQLHDEFGSNDPSTFDTVNTLIDFEVVSTTKKDNVTELEFAPYVPIALGRKIPNFANADGYTLTQIDVLQKSGTITATHPNVVESTNDLIKQFDRNDPVFIGSSPSTATFAGFVRTLRLKRGSAIESNLLYLDRDVSYDAGDKIYSVSKDTHDLHFVNGAHLWGGKMVSIAHPKMTSLGSVPLNMENFYLTDGDTHAKYGQPYYRMLSMSKGNFNYIRHNPSSGIEDAFRETYSNQSNLKYNSIAYRFSPNYPSNTPIPYDKTGTGDDIHMDIELRGYDGPYGSLFNGQTRLRRNLQAEHKIPDEFVGNEFLLDSFISSLAQKDSSAATLFLYLTSDLLPYSSLRKDSLMDGNKTLTNYNLFLLENKAIKDSSRGATETSTGNQVLLNDNSFQTLSISQDIDIASLKRFGLMRLTELCFDVHFNPFNPEKPPVKDDAYFNFNSFNAYIFEEVGTIDVAATLAASTDEVVLSAETLAPSSPNTIYDDNYKFIGVVSSYDGGTLTITLNDDAYLNDDGTFTTGKIYRSTSNNIIDLYGAKDKNTFLNEDRAHIQKGAIIRNYYQTSSSDAWYHNNDDLALSWNVGTVATSPIRFHYDNSLATLSGTIRNMPSRPFFQYFASTRNVFYRASLVALATYPIEDGGLYPVEDGVTVPLEGDRINRFNNTVTGEYTDILSFNLTNFSDRPFAKKYPQTQDTADNTASSVRSPTYPAIGAKIALKPRFYYDSGAHTSSTIDSSNGTLYVYELNVFGTRHVWLDMIDITGCYLASEAGSDTIIQNSVSSGDSLTSDCRNMEGVIPNDLIHVISHTVKNTGGDFHVLVLDKPLTNLTAYRILKPNETTFYDYSPKQITLNMLSSKYTKMATENKMYNVQQDIDIIDGTQGKHPTDGGTGPRREAFLSMYVAVDPDKQSSSEDYLVMRKAENFLDVLPVGNHDLYLTDGDNGHKAEINVKSNYDFTGEQDIILTFNAMKELHGVVSASETFTLQCFEELKINPTRAAIGATATVCLEAEDLINELFEQNNIDFDISDDTDYPYYLAPNFKGIDLYATIRYIMEKKDMVLLEENGTFSITQGNDSSHYSNVLLNESSKFKIFEFEKATTLFDFYNEIIVYGNTHKAERKDLRSVQKRGRKTLEHHDKTLITQEEVDKKAIELLRLHSTFNQKLIMTVGHEGLSQLRAGDIINVELKQENIEIGQYMVLQIEHELTGLMRLELGRYSKQLSDLFSELLVTQKQINSNLRNEKFNEKSVAYNFLETLNLKELRLLIRKRQAIGGFTLGFGETLNTGDNPLGFNGGVITITELLDEDLT